MAGGLTSVSKICGFPDKPYLVGWASKVVQEDYHRVLNAKRTEMQDLMAKEAMLPSVRELIDSFPSDLATANDVTSRSRSIGTLFHKAIQMTIESNNLTQCLDVFATANADIAHSAMVAYQNWFGWWRKFNCNGITDPKWVVSTEVDLKDEELKVYGRCDMVSACPMGEPKDGKEALILVDWKSSNDIYLNDILEVAAYWAMLAKAEKLATVNKAYIIRCSKDELAEPRVFEILREDAIMAWDTFVSLSRSVAKYDALNTQFGQKIMPVRGRKGSAGPRAVRTEHNPYASRRWSCGIRIGSQ